MPERADVISLFRHRPPAWEAAPDQTMTAEPARSLADQLEAASSQDTAQAGRAATPSSARAAHQPPVGGEVTDRNSSNSQRLRLARELLRPVNQATSTAGTTRTSDSDRPGGSDVDS